MKIEPVITDVGILLKSKACISFYSMEMKYEDYTLILYGHINTDSFSKKTDDEKNNCKRCTLYFHDTIFLKCYDFDYRPHKVNFESLFYINNNSKLVKKITKKRNTKYIHYTLTTNAYIFEIICNNYLIELYNNDNNFDKIFNENEWITFSERYKNYHSKNKDELLLKFGLDDRLASVIDGIIGENSIEWIFIKLPELNNLSPIECKRNIKLKNRLKTMLMRI